VKITFQKTEKEAIHVLGNITESKVEEVGLLSPSETVFDAENFYRN
jgi:hypothetical protein